MTTWNKTTEEKYWEMLEVLPPAIMTGNGFLVGEPLDHNSAGQPRYEAFVEKGGEFYVAAEAMTVADFRKVSPSEVAA